MVSRPFSTNKTAIPLIQTLHASGNTWSRLPKNNAVIQTIAINQWWGFYRDAELSVIQRDRNFLLQVCEEPFNNCANVPGVFVSRSCPYKIKIGADILFPSTASPGHW